MEPRRWPALLVSGVLAALTPLAYASPPDPSWLNGVYNGADFNDVVESITSGISIVDSQALCSVEPTPVVVASVFQGDETPRPAQPLAARQIRAPPAL